MTDETQGGHTDSASEGSDGPGSDFEQGGSDSQDLTNPAVPAADDQWTPTTFGSHELKESPGLGDSGKIEPREDR